MIQEKEQEKELDFIKKVQRDILFKFSFFTDKIDGLCPNAFYGLTEEKLCRGVNLKMVDMEDIKENYKKLLHSFKRACFNNKFTTVDSLERLLSLLYDKRMQEFIF